MGLLHALNWFKNLGLDNVIIEVDCKTVIDLVNYPRENIFELGSIIKECHNFISYFQNLNMRFMRHANKVAHNLARAINSLSRPYDFYYVPHCIAPLILNEMH